MDDGIHWTSPGVRFQVSILCQVGKEDTVYEFWFKNPYSDPDPTIIENEAIQIRHKEKILSCSRGQKIRDLDP